MTALSLWRPSPVITCLMLNEILHENEVTDALAAIACHHMFDYPK